MMLTIAAQLLQTRQYMYICFSNVKTAWTEYMLSILFISEMYIQLEIAQIDINAKEVYVL